MRSWT